MRNFQRGIRDSRFDCNGNISFTLSNSVYDVFGNQIFVSGLSGNHSMVAWNMLDV